MRPHLCCYILFSLFFISQVNHVGSKRLQEKELLELQLKVENLIEKIINSIQDFKQNMKTEVKCIPDYVSKTLMEILKNAIICFEENEKDYNSGKISNKTRAKNFLQCLTNGKREIRDMMESIDTTIDYCPDNATEKTYQINVTTTFSKTFLVTIKNGLEVTEKEIELYKDTKHPFGGEQDSMEESEEDESEMENDKEHRDAVTHQYGVKKTEEGKNFEKPKTGKKSNITSSTTEDSKEFDYKDNDSAESSTKKTKGGHHQVKHPEEGERKKQDDSDQNDYTDDYDTELSSGSSEDSDEKTEDHVHRQFF